MWRCAALLLCGGLLFSGGCGCGKKAPPLPEVYTDRARDPEYMAFLQERQKRNIEVAQIGADIARQMTQHVERVRATFPVGVGDEVLTAALAADPEWRKLEARAEEQKELAQKVWEENRDIVRNRMLEQDQAQKDVAAGAARAINDKPRPMPPGFAGKKE